jgi:hypothetical protein
MPGPPETPDDGFAGADGAVGLAAGPIESPAGFGAAAGAVVGLAATVAVGGTAVGLGATVAVGGTGVGGGAVGVGWAAAPPQAPRINPPVTQAIRSHLGRRIVPPHVGDDH